VADLVFWLPIAFALLAPINLLGRGRPRVGRAALGAFAPAILFGIAALIASRTAWGNREPPGEFTASNTFGLVLYCVISTLAGIAGMVVAGLGYLMNRSRPTPTRRS
jgi:NADH:ubiquinone oxidoreductase subunit 5 (subunit L)/multisubunit Na+/H+ antiporter MnhA subunit